MRVTRRKGQSHHDVMVFGVTVRRFPLCLALWTHRAPRQCRLLLVWWTRRPPCVRTGTVASGFGRQRLLHIRRARMHTRTRMQTGLVEVFMHTQAHARKHTRARGTETSFRCQALAIIQCTLAGQLQSTRCTHIDTMRMSTHTRLHGRPHKHTRPHTRIDSHRVPC